VGYILLVGVPLVGLLGILEAGRSIAAPMSVGGDWVLDVDPAACPSGVARLRQPVLSIVQSGTDALVTLNDGRATQMPATIAGAALNASALRATIAGKPNQRALTGTLQLDGCPPLTFRATRQAPARKGGE
jgi:hypothetical protein